MIKTLLAIRRIQWAMTANRVIFWVGRIPLIKRLVSDSLYQGHGGKVGLNVVLTVSRVVQAIFGKFLYLFLCCLIPAYFVSPHIGADRLTAAWPIFLWILFVLSFLCGTFSQPSVLTPTLLKYTCIRQMGVPVRPCLWATGGLDHIVTFLTFSLALAVAAPVMGQPIWVGLGVSLALAAMRLVAEVFVLLLYRKTKKYFWGHPLYVTLLVIFLPMVAYFPLLFMVDNPVRWPLPMDWLTHPLALIAFVVAGCLSLLFLVKFPHYSTMMVSLCRPEFVSTDMRRGAAAKSAFRDVVLRDKDLQAGGNDAKINTLTGYRYLNALFFRRHRRILLQPARVELIILGILLVAGLIACLLWREIAGELMNQLPRSLPVFVFIIYLLGNLVGERICRAMFYNCDLSLLRFGWYRSPQVVLTNFRIRLKEIAKVNLAVGLALCLIAGVFWFASGSTLAGREVLLWCFAILCLELFFTVHPIFMYYIFQPYTATLTTKNPFFSLINVVVYVVCYACIQLRQPPQGFAIIVLVATLIYSVVALLLVWKKAPATFRVK